MSNDLTHIWRGPLSAIAFKPWHLLGFGYYQAWVYLAVMSTVLYPNSAFFNETVAFTRPLYSLSLAVCLLVFVLVGTKFNLLDRAVPLVAAGVLTLAGTLTIALPTLSGQPSMTAVLGGIVATSLGNALCVLGWGSKWTSISPNRMGMHIVVSNCFAGVLYLVVVALPPALAITVTALLPLCSIGTLLCCIDEPTDGRRPVARPSKGLFAKSVAILILIPVVYGIARAFSSEQFAGSFSESYRLVILGITCFALALLAVSVTASHERIIMRLYRLVMPLMIIGFMAWSFVGDGALWLAFAAIGCGFYCFEGLTWLLYPRLVVRLGKVDVPLFGWSRILFHLFGFVGSTVGFALVGEGVDAPPYLSVICLFIVAVLVISITYLFTERDLRLFLSTPRTSSADDVETACGELSAAYGLSKRESEVLVLFAKGRSAPFIAEAFSVSKGTVKTHIRHIYEKLDVHSKQELLDLIEKQREEA